MEKYGKTVFSHVDTSFLPAWVNYIINSKYRKSVKLVTWLKKQVDNPSNPLKAIVAEIPTRVNPDEQIIEILKYVNNKLSYYGDTEIWDMAEHWNTVDETIEIWKGDCEDGGILIYVLARLKGIPVNQIYICAGNVQGGGHAWVGYKPKNYPLNFSFIDWCYWYNSNTMGYRNKFSILDKAITEYKYGTNIDTISKYYNVWFIFNEEKSYVKLKPIVMRN